MEEPPSATAVEPSTTVLRKRTRGRTQTAENPERTSAGSDQEERESSPDDFKEARPRAKRGRPAAAAVPSPAAPQKLAGLTLIEVIKGNGKLIPQAVKLWVERYEKDPKPAMVELLMMLFEACGAKYQFKGELLDEIDVDDVVVALVELARSGNVEDYQSSKKKEFKNFKENLQSFWDNLVRECQHGPLVDQILFEECMDYIIALSWLLLKCLKLL